MERLSFISGSSANEDEDEEEEDEDEECDPMAVLLPPPPLPPKPPVLLNQQPRCLYPDQIKRESTPIALHSPYISHGSSRHVMQHGDEFTLGSNSDLGTVRRKAKRDRNRTATTPEAMKEPLLPPLPVMMSEVSKSRSSTSTSKSRSKSRSPGRSIEGNRTGSSRASCSLHASRGNSPDNISESSTSFHENELIQPASTVGGAASEQPLLPAPPLPPLPKQHSQKQQPQKQQPQAHFRSGGHQGSSSSSSSVPAAASSGPSAAAPWMTSYANRDSVRESWISSGSSDHHHLIHHHYHHRRVVPAQVSSGGTSDASNKSVQSGGHHQPRKGQGPNNKGVKTSSVTLPRTTSKGQQPLTSCLKHQSRMTTVSSSRSISRDSGSSSSRTVSRSESRSGLMRSSRSGSSSALQRPRSGTLEGKTNNYLVQGGFFNH